MSKNMNKIGIIAEYNPFTNGHKYQLDYAKDVLGADCVIIAMSGSFSQRGEVCIFDKYTRANCALINGADIVLELPTFYSCSSASDFAAGAVNLLHKAGINTLLFGVENGDNELFEQVANSLISLENDPNFTSELNTLQKEGESFATSYYKVASNILNIDSNFFLNSNNILGIEYCKAILKNNYNIKIQCLQRKGSNYNDADIQTNFASASAIRKIIHNDKAIKHNNIEKFIPENTFEIIREATIISENDVSEILHYALLSIGSYESYYDCNENISNTIKKQLNSYVDFNSFAEIISSKTLSISRAKRILTHILLNIHTSDVKKQKDLNYITYIRILGFSKNGSQYLKDIKNSTNVPVISAPSEFKANDVCFNADIHSSDINRLLITKKTGESIKTEFTRKNNLINL